MSAQELADRCAALGHPIQRSVIANLESGRRTTVTVAELIIFGAALEVPPAYLVFPAGYEPEVEMIPGLVRETYEAAAWFMGDQVFPPPVGEKVDEDEEKRLMGVLDEFPMTILKRTSAVIDLYVDSLKEVHEQMAAFNAAARRYIADVQAVERVVEQIDRIEAEREAILADVREDDPEATKRAVAKRAVLQQEIEGLLQGSRELRARMNSFKNDESENLAVQRKATEMRDAVAEIISTFAARGWVQPLSDPELDELLSVPDTWGDETEGAGSDAAMG